MFKINHTIFEWQLNRSTRLEEKSANSELEDYLRESCIYCLHDDSLQWWRKIRSNKYMCILVRPKEFLSICASNFPLEHLFSTSRGIIIFRRERLALDTISALMILKSLNREDANNLQS